MDGTNGSLDFRINALAQDPDTLSLDRGLPVQKDRVNLGVVAKWLQQCELYGGRQCERPQ